MMQEFVLALDQGTTSSRAIVFGRDGRIRGMAQTEFRQIYPAPGHVEHDPEDIWSSQLSVAREALANANVTADQIAALGITNQRETVVLWDRRTGEPVANAFVWQSRKTAGLCERLKADGFEELIRRTTGLVIDPYFSGTKIRWMLDELPGVRQRAERGDIAFGTVDSYLIWKLTGGRVHVTDVSNASRTLAFNIHTLDWDDELLEMLHIPRCIMPDVRSNSEVYGETETELFGKSLPIAGAAGDQQAATFGQACFAPGMAKNTYGTGCFVLLNTGQTPVTSAHGLLTTVGWQINGETTYCLEGSIFVAGAAVQWLRDELQIIESAADIEPLAGQVESPDGVYFVPALVGLASPFWNPAARGTIVGLTRGTSRSHLARATLEAIAYRTRDVCDAMLHDEHVTLQSLKADGGAAANNLLMQMQADVLGVPVQRPVVNETTALGAAYLAGLAVGVWKGTNEIVENWALDREFTPTPEADIQRRYPQWQRAVQRAIDWDTTVS